MTNSVNTLEHRDWALTKASTVEGYMSTDELTWLYDNAYGQSVEMGSYRGRSGTIIGLKLKETGGHLSCIDCFGDAEYKIFQENIKKSDLLVDVYRMTSVEAVDHFDDHSLDFVFIDSSHEYDDTLEEIIGWLPKVKLDGLLCGHDYNHPEFPGLTRAVNELCIGFENPVDSIWCIRVSEFSNLQRDLFDLLRKTKRDLSRKETQYNDQLVQLQGAVNYYEAQFPQVQGAVNWYKEQLTQLQGVVNDYQTEVENYKSQLSTKNQLIETKKMSIQNLKKRIDQLKDRGNSLQLEVEAMKTSKFWKLRSLWMKIKSFVGLAREEP
ncbi:MAG: hypothetical protein F6K30_12040 [Cyanothece sp. SIO2G6]|nr:hypothetical protein [Cyanothece sp. SIO2G6]